MWKKVLSFVSDEAAFERLAQVYLFFGSVRGGRMQNQASSYESIEIPGWKLGQYHRTRSCEKSESCFPLVREHVEREHALFFAPSPTLCYIMAAGERIRSLPNLRLCW